MEPAQEFLFKKKTNPEEEAILKKSPNEIISKLIKIDNLTEDVSGVVNGMLRSEATHTSPYMKGTVKIVTVNKFVCKVYIVNDMIQMITIATIDGPKSYSEKEIIKKLSSGANESYMDTEYEPAEEAKKWGIAEKMLYKGIKANKKAHEKGAKFKQFMTGQDYDLTDWDLAKIGDMVKRWCKNHSEFFAIVKSAKSGKLVIEFTGGTVPTKDQFMSFRGVKSCRYIDHVDVSGNTFTLYSTKGKKKDSANEALTNLENMNIPELFDK